MNKLLSSKCKEGMAAFHSYTKFLRPSSIVAQVLGMINEVVQQSDGKDYTFVTSNPQLLTSLLGRCSSCFYRDTHELLYCVFLFLGGERAREIEGTQPDSQYAMLMYGIREEVCNFDGEECLSMFIYFEERTKTMELYGVDIILFNKGRNQA